ncbi:OprD family outer membrane porin [Acinetobacter lanii]|uniref:OprD family porin n=1 Tax=Acinetobacter lanii TaxID=2715163 RepID=A0A6G8S735_9GAMM|nr:OprD family outer membrane porin [Acinetobacter lanii]QIO09911.1 OprD family porin [Acinetobacter lanii]
MRRQSLSLLLCAASVALANSNASAGFIDDSKVQLQLKNFYYVHEVDELKAGQMQDYGSWTQGALFSAKSGYAEFGPLKLGLDATAQYAWRLDGERSNADYVLPYNYTTHKQQDDFGKWGVTLKAKVSETELRVGEIFPMTPIVYFDPSRQLITSYEGAWLESKDIKNTKVTLGYLWSINARYNNQFDDFTLWPNEVAVKDDKRSDGMYVAGIDHQLTKNIALSYFYGEMRDIYRQNYLGVDYKKQLDAKNKIASHVHYFDNREAGDAMFNEIDNQAVSFKFDWTHGPHMLEFGYQQMFGEHTLDAPYFPSIAGWVPQPYLSNWSVAAFVRKDEKSWSLGYTYDFADAGIKGLSASVKYYDGWNIDNNGLNGNYTSGKEDEVDVVINYVKPEGKLKGLGLQLKYINVDYANVENFGDVTEYRVTTSYTHTF